MRLLALSDEIDGAITAERLKEMSPDAIVACGDLPFDYLEFVVTVANVPLLYVPGNHDPELSGRPLNTDLFGALGGRGRRTWREPPGPQGCTNIDGKIVTEVGTTFAGLGGSVRYSRDPNQYTQAQMRWRAARLETAARLRRPFRGGVDVFIAHSPPWGVGDRDDPAHRGFRAFHRLVRALRPRVFVHGHIHPWGHPAPEQSMNATCLINAIPHRIVEI